MISNPVEANRCLHSAPPDDPPCVRQQNAEIASAESLEGFYPVSMYSIVQCETDGSYYPKQCDVRSRECWCVDEAGMQITYH